MIRVFYDSQIFLAQERGGISRYFVELIREFKLHPEYGIEPVLNIQKSHNLHLWELLQIPLKSPSSSKFSRAMDLLGQSISDARFSNYDIRHFTFYMPMFFHFKDPSVSTLYDMIPELYMKNGRNPHMSKRAYMKNSTGVVSISENSLVDLEKIYGDRPRMAKTVYLGADKAFQGDSEVPPWLPKKYFLYVGQRDGYKRGRLAIELLHELDNDELSLVFVGPTPMSSSEEKLVNELGLSGRVHFYNAPASHLPGIYKRALFLAYPNLYEGFGFPPIEAQMAGTQVIAVDNSINREISGDGIHYFEADNLQNFKEVSMQVLNRINSDTSTLRGTYIASKYSWAQCAMETADFYRQILKETKP